MNRRGKLAILLLVLVLITLLLISSTDLVLAEKQSTVYSISVLVPDTNDECWINYKKGMDQASIAYNADLSFVTLYARGQVAEQQELALREVENGAQALIIAPADSDEMTRYLSNNNLGVQVVSLYSQLPIPSVRGGITADWYEIGDSLSQAVWEDSGHTQRDTPQTQIVAVSFPGVRDNVETTYQGLADGFTALNMGSSFRRMIISDSNEAASLLNQENVESIVALEPSVFQLLTEELGKLEKSNVKLYGVGCTNRVLRELESGLVRAAAVCGDYDAGYLSVRTAVELLSGQGGSNHTVRHILVRPGKLYSKEYEMMLFPIS